MEYKRLGDYIREVNVRNKDLKVTNLQGVSISKLFIPSIANTIGTDMSTYKVVNPGQFAYGPVTSRNGDKVSIALYKGDDDAIISQAYTVFEVVDKDKILLKYVRGPFGSALKKEDMQTCGVPVYEQQHVIDNHRDFRYYVSTEKYEQLKRFSVKENDLVISCSGTIGRIIQIEKNDPIGIINQANQRGAERENYRGWREAQLWLCQVSA